MWDETAQLNPTAQVWKSCQYHYIPWSSSFKMLTMTMTMTMTTMLTLMKMITRSSPLSPPLPSPPQDPWTGDPVLRSSTTTSPFQGFQYNSSCHYFDYLVCRWCYMTILTLICSRQRPSSLKKSASLATTTSPHSFLGSNQNPHLATATEITRFWGQQLFHQIFEILFSRPSSWTPSPSPSSSSSSSPSAL